MNTEIIVPIPSLNEIHYLWTHIMTSSQLAPIAQLVEHCTGITEVRIKVLCRPEFATS